MANSCAYYPYSVECTSANAAKYDRVCMNAAVIADFLETADGAEEASGVVVEKLDKLPKKLARADIQQLFEHAAESLALQHRVADMVQGKGEEQMGLFGDEYDQDLEAFADINAVDAASRSRGVVSRKLLSIYDGTCGPHNPCEEGFCCSREGVGGDMRDIYEWRC